MIDPTKLPEGQIFMKAIPLSDMPCRVVQVTRHSSNDVSVRSHPMTLGDHYYANAVIVRHLQRLCGGLHPNLGGLQP